MTPRLVSLFLIPSLLLSISTFSPAADLTTTTGKTLSGKLTKFENGLLSLETQAGVETIALKDLLVINFAGKPKPIEKYDQLELTDGSRLKLNGFKITTKTIQPNFAGTPDANGLTVDLPLANVFYLLRGAEVAKNREDWKKLVDGRGKRDLFVSRSSDGVLSPLPGTVIEGSADGDSVNFEREDGQRTTLQLRRATGGILFNPPPQGVVASTIGQAFDAFGNELYIQSFTLTGSAITLKTVHGAVFKYASIDSLTRLDFTQGNIAYLSALEPTVNAPKPIPGEPYYTFLKDKNQTNDAIRLGGTIHPRGLWMASDVSLTYKLASDYRELKATIGVDDSIDRMEAQVKLIIEGDGRKLFDGLVSRKDPPRDLVLDVKGVRELKITTVAPNAQYQGNQVTLANVRLQK